MQLSFTRCRPSIDSGRFVLGAFINSGQTCASMKRLYVHDDVCSALVGFSKNIPVCNGLDEASILGPIQNKMQYQKVEELVDDAVSNGAHIYSTEGKTSDTGFFYPTTLLTNVSDDMRIVKEE